MRTAGYFFLCFAFAYSAIAAKDDLKIFSIRKPVSILRASSEIPELSRGLVLQAGDVVRVGSRGGVTFDGDDNCTLSVIGPAIFRFEKDGGTAKKLHFDYGDFYLKKSRRQFIVVSTVFFDLENHAEEMEFFFETPFNTQFFRLRSMSDDLAIRGKEIPKRYFVQGNGESWASSPLEADDLHFTRERHFNNRQAQDLSTQQAKAYDPELADALPGLVEIFPYAGTTKFITESAGVGQYSGFVGFGLKVGTHLYPALPAEPQRLDFIYSPVVRLGLELGAYSGNFRIASTLTRPHFLLLGGFAGLGFHGLNLDAIFGYPLAIVLSGEGGAYSVPFYYGLDFNYRIDLFEMTQSETGLTLGLRALALPLKGIASSLRSQAALNSSNLGTWNFAPFVALSMRF